MRSRALLCCVALASALALAGLVPTIARTEPLFGGTGDWPHFGYDDAYTAYNPIEQTIAVTNVVDLRRKWGIGCNDGYFSVIFRSPAIYNGVLYTSGAGDRLRAYNARMGQKLWEFGQGNYGWAPQPVVSSDGVVFYMEGANPTYLYAVNGQTGAQLWKAPIGFELGFSGAAEAVVTVGEANGLVFVLEKPFSGDGKLYALDKQTGTISWYMSDATDGTDFRGNYPLLGGGKIYAAADVATASYPFHAEHPLRIDPTTQTVERTYDRPVPDNYYAIEQVAMCNDRLIVNYDYQYDATKLIVAYDPISSTIAWQNSYSSTITGKIACNTDLNRIYVPTDPYLYALDASDGSDVWSYLGYGEIYNPSVANGVVYFLSDNNMYAVDEASGHRLVSYPLGYEADETTQVAIAGGMLYFSGNGGTCDLFALALPGPDTAYLPFAIRSR